MIRSIAIIDRPELPTDFTHVRWEPWKCRPEDTPQMLANLAVHKRLRERGGILPDEKLQYQVCVSDPDRYPVVSFHAFKFTITKE